MSRWTPQKKATQSHQRKTISITFATGAIALASLGTASAALTAQDGFDSYSTGAIGTQGSAGSGWAGAYSSTTNGSATVTSGSLGAVSTGNKVMLSGVTAGSATTVRDLSPTITGNFYIGFSFQSNSDSVRSAGIQLRSSDSSEKAFIGISNGEGTRKLGIYGSTTGVSSTTAGNGTTYQLVVKVSFNASGSNEVLQLFIDQATEGTANATATYNFNGYNGSQENFGRIALFAGGGADTTTASFDNVRIATTYAEALAVPEPSSALLIGSFAALALLRRRR